MFSRLAQVTLVALALTIGNHANAAPLAYGTYYDETVFFDCVNADFCRINFSQLPADKLLMVQKIHCRVLSTQPLTGGSFEIAASFGGGAVTSRSLPIAVPPSQLIGSSYNTNFREDTHFLVGAGRFPHLWLFTKSNASSNGACTMIGELVTPL